MYYKRRSCLSSSQSTVFSTDRKLSEQTGFRVLAGSSDTFRCTSILTGNSADPLLKKRASEAVGLILRQYLTDRKRVLAAGIGNSAVTPDSLGPRCIGRLIPSPDTTPSLYTTSPGVPAKTGIDTAAMVRSAAEIVRADCILTVDALASRSEESLASMIQITDQGTAPGSGAGNGESSPICTDTMGIPVISVGVPTVKESGNLLVTPADCDRIIDTFSQILARGITNALFS